MIVPAPNRPSRASVAWTALLLWLLAAPAFALGLGQIQVKSKPGEPLLAEIPIVSSEPSELQGLQARLASPETFRRVGLEPPQGIVSDLVFTPAVDERGRPVIRVTSREPVRQPELAFLLEVDWGQGRLVREYSALVDTPRSVAAPLPPVIQAPVAPPPAASSGTIERPADPVAQAPAPAAAPPVPTPPAPETAPPPVAATPAAPSPAAPAAPAAAAAPAGDDYRVQRGDTLGKIAAGLPGTSGATLDQTMVALLRANPEAFIEQDINRLRQGAVLRVPAADELIRTSAADAAVLVRDQVANWRQARSAAQAAAATSDGASAEAADPPRAPAPTATAQTTAPARVADARLEIAPPRADAATRAGTQSGASAGGEGEMLRQELQQTRETLAARDAEVQELKAKVAELEQLQKQQQSLIAMKDDALAGAQQKLADRQAAAPAASVAAPEPAPAAEQGGLAWWWLLPAALLVGAVAWLVSRRRRPDAPAPTDNGRISDAFAAPAEPASVPVAAKPKPAPVAAREPEPAPRSAPAPAWAAKAKSAAPDPAPVPAAVGSSPTWMTGGPAEVSPSAGDTIASLNQAPAGRDRIELAQAYANLGDRSTARTLLQEVIAGGDAKARDEAARVLQSLG